MSKRFFSLFMSAFLLLMMGSRVLAQEDEVYLGGDSIGIKAVYDGVMITGTYRFEANGKTYDPAALFQAKDMIVAINDQPIQTLEDLYTALNDHQQQENKLSVDYIRDETKHEGTLTVVYDDKQHTFRSGLYVKDSISGVGTLTYYDPLSQTYGALGHEIIDSDLQELAQVHNGSIYASKVTSIRRSQKDNIGEKHAAIDYTKPLGTLQDNTIIGIYGASQKDMSDRQRLPWAKQTEVKLGDAYLYTVLEGTMVKRFHIQITDLQKQAESDVKGITFVIDDERLLKKSGGIVQGMSGSPIVQDGKLIGAVTHVAGAMPQKGYGVYIEWMLERSRSSG